MDKIREMLDNNTPDQAIEHINAMLAQGKDTHIAKDELFYLRGNAYRQKSDWCAAMNDYLAAIAINPESPATEAYSIIEQIMGFFNKDLYNQ